MEYKNSQGDSHISDSAFDIRLLPTPWQFACLLPVNMLTMRIESTSHKRSRCDLEAGRKIPIKLLDYKALPGLIKIFGPMEALNLLGIRFTKAVVMDSMIPLNEKRRYKLIGDHLNAILIVDQAKGHIQKALIVVSTTTCSLMWKRR
uniref:Uncharacterized protein n=1 Tax=Oryza brachyantha TaxID=4533 RepID=J3M5B2_ORYBR